MPEFWDESISDLLLIADPVFRNLGRIDDISRKPMHAWLTESVLLRCS